MISCEPQELVISARCFHRCLAGAMNDAVSIYLLCQWAGGDVLQDPPIPQSLFSSRLNDTTMVIGTFDFPGGLPGVIEVRGYRSTNQGGPFTDLIGSFDPSTGNTIVDSTGVPNENYYYVLRTVGDGIIYQAVESDDSDIMCAMVFAPIIGSLNFGSTTAIVGWTYDAPTPTQDWVTQWSTDIDFSVYGELIKPSSLNELYQVITGLTPSTDYYARVRARNSDTCKSGFSDPFHFKTADP